MHGRQLACSSSIVTHKTRCTPAPRQRCLATQRCLARSWYKGLNYNCALLVFPLGGITKEAHEGRGEEKTMQHNNEGGSGKAKQVIWRHKTLLLVTMAQSLLVTILTWRRGSKTLTCDALVLCSSGDVLVQQVEFASCT